MRRVITLERLVMWFAAFHVLLLLLKLIQNAQSDFDSGDWHFIREMGRRFLDGEWEGIYGVSHDGFYWRFPPFGLYPAAILAVLPKATAYWVKVGVEAAATLVAVRLVVSLLPDMRSPDVAALVIIGSSAFASTLALGQNAGTMLLIIAAGLWLAERRGRILGFGTWGLLAVKPNIGAGFALFALVRRRIGEVAAMATVAALLVAVSLPLWSLWDDFFRTSLRAEDIREGYAAINQVTLLGFLEGVGLSRSWLAVLWPLAVICMLGAALRVWTAPVPFVRRAGVTVLLVTAANPYLSFYDGLLLAAPGLVWWGAADSYRNRNLWKGIAVCITVIWVDQHIPYTYLNLLSGPLIGLDVDPRLPFSLVGLMVTIWLILETVDAGRISRRHRDTVPSSPTATGFGRSA